jgi:hypothetical protein
MSDEPKRIQRKRTKGWRMPEGAVYVGRPSFYGNPFVVGKDGDVAECLRRYRIYVMTGIIFEPEQYAELRGKDLACWCALDVPCHADVLLEIANAPTIDKQYGETNK